MTRILHRVSLAMGARPPFESMAVVNCPSSGGLTFHSCDPNFHSGNLKSDMQLEMIEYSDIYRVPQKYRPKVYGSEGHKNGANQILILCMFFSTSGHLV